MKGSRSLPSTLVDRIKKDVSLVEVAARNGYALDKKGTSKNCVRMKSGGDTIIIKKAGDSNWVYCNVHDSMDKGSVIDFMMNRNRGSSFREIVETLSECYLGLAQTDLILPSYAEMKAVEKCRAVVERELNSMSAALCNRYLVYRGISGNTQSDFRFKGTILEDSYRNAVFPHQDEKGFCGAEKRNHGFKGFSKGGEKSLWLSNRFTNDTKLVIVEGAIDALSYHVLMPSVHTRYASIGGEPSPTAWKLIASMIVKFKAKGGLVVSAVDNDDGGDGLHSKLETHVGTKIGRELPTSDDWNNDLIQLTSGN